MSAHRPPGSCPSARSRGGDRGDAHAPIDIPSPAGPRGRGRAAREPDRGLSWPQPASAGKQDAWRWKVTCWTEVATIVGTQGDDVIIGTPGRDIIAGLGGDDVIKGLGGHDLICGGRGDDRLKGHQGRDWLFGNAGRDKLFGGKGIDFLEGGGG